MWAWILSALKSDEVNNPRYLIARNVLAKLGVPTPAPQDVSELHTERSFKQIYTRQVAIPPLPGRLDIYLRISGATPAIVFIENKVADNQNHIESLYKQIASYDRNFHVLKAASPAYPRDIYPAYFGYEEWVAGQLSELAARSDPELAARLRFFTLGDMLEAFKDTGFQKEPVLQQFYLWLTVKKKFVTIRRKARTGNHASVDEVIDAAIEVGFGELLQAFMDGFHRHPTFRHSVTNIQTDIRNINFRRGGSTPLTVRWFYNSGPNGLYVGVHTDVERMTGVNLFRRLPADFGYEQEQQWVFGYLRTQSQVEALWAGE
ncbi:hypothetical protein [Mycobacterium sp. TY815]|uniref:hypothetical protein n=1 Tax=Mycobacterium sp. TY815 TaxID=3050581 RepID=UPI0027412E25|nr:hypothetical protein [Mycobacterium sp. TY815]MDP7707435.1 hypothetical protein [Mycobacterium sp. TY815]